MGKLFPIRAKSHRCPLPRDLAVDIPLKILMPNPTLFSSKVKISHCILRFWTLLFLKRHVRQKCQDLHPVPPFCAQDTPVLSCFEHRPPQREHVFCLTGRRIYLSLDGKDRDQDHAVLHSASSRQFPAGRFRRLGARQGFHHDMGHNQSTIGQLCVRLYCFLSSLGRDVCFSASDEKSAEWCG